MINKIKKILLLVLVFLIIGVGLRYILDKTYLSNYTRNKIVEDNIYNSMLRINQERWKKSKEAVLSNIYSISDGVSATPFAYEKNIPMYFSESFELNDEMKQEFRRLELDKIYIVGGEGSINKNVEKEIHKMGIKTERIFGEESFDTSLKLAKKLSKITDIKQIAIVNNDEGRANGVILASPASKNNIPIIMMDKKNINDVLEFIKKENIQKTYIIGNENQFSQEFIKKIPNATRIVGKNIFETNIMIIKEFYNLENIEKVYMTKIDEQTNIEFINTLCLSTVAANQDIPILLNSKSLQKEQNDFLKEIGVDEFTQVGFELVRPRFINPQSIKVAICLSIVAIWMIAIRRVIYSN